MFSFVNFNNIRVNRTIIRLIGKNLICIIIHRSFMTFQFVSYNIFKLNYFKYAKLKKKIKLSYKTYILTQIIFSTFSIIIGRFTLLFLVNQTKVNC